MSRAADRSHSSGGGMYWEAAVRVARLQDVSYEEWCDLYLSRTPSPSQIHIASEAARRVLIRVGAIKPDALIDETKR